jgi:UDP-N-acetylmuramate dehydrogenase
MDTGNKMIFKQDISLKPYNTFGIDCDAKLFVSITNQDELIQLIQTKEFINNNKLVLGGGSNILLTGDFEGLVIKNDIKGIEKIKEDEHHVWIKTGAGEVWHSFVLYCIENGYAGVENLSLIPGTVGAAPMQNIGAYGVEIKDVFESLEAISILNGQSRAFNNNDCKFGYRESAFKHEFKGEYIITSVVFKLNKIPQFNVSYGAIGQVLKNNNITKLTIKAVSDAVIEIRSSKLPDPKVLGNSGSFFKNPEVNIGKAEELKALYPEMPLYPMTSTTKKLASGWLVEQCGWKGKRVGDTGAHKDQALVLVNYGNAKGKEIWELAIKIKQSVWDKFGVFIEPEVNVI